MTESVYKVIELIGTSKDSWEKAAQAAVDRAGKSLRMLRNTRTAFEKAAANNMNVCHCGRRRLR